VACAGSVTAPDFADRFVGTAVERYKGLDIIVNNAGYTWDNVIQKMTDEQWYAMIDVHLTAPFRILRAAATGGPPLVKAEAEAGRRVPQGGQHLVGRRHCSATPARPTTRPARPASWA
jgi:3-oxoacyl-[acyl-carrier protein] reductase